MSFVPPILILAQIPDPVPIDPSHFDPNPEFA
jgi:hypothetical protein